MMNFERGIKSNDFCFHDFFFFFQIIFKLIWFFFSFFFLSSVVGLHTYKLLKTNKQKVKFEKIHETKKIIILNANFWILKVVSQKI